MDHWMPYAQLMCFAIVLHQFATSPIANLTSAHFTSPRRQKGMSDALKQAINQSRCRGCPTVRPCPCSDGQVTYAKFALEPVIGRRITAVID